MGQETPCTEAAHVCDRGSVGLMRLAGVHWGNMGSTDSNRFVVGWRRAPFEKKKIQRKKTSTLPFVTDRALLQWVHIQEVCLDFILFWATKWGTSRRAADNSWWFPRVSYLEFPWGKTGHSCPEFDGVIRRRLHSFHPWRAWLSEERGGFLQSLLAHFLKQKGSLEGGALVIKANSLQSLKVLACIMGLTGLGTYVFHYKVLYSGRPQISLPGFWDDLLEWARNIIGALFCGRCHH